MWRMLRKCRNKDHALNPINELLSTILVCNNKDHRQEYSSLWSLVIIYFYYYFHGAGTFPVAGINKKDLRLLLKIDY